MKLRLVFAVIPLLAASALAQAEDSAQADKAAAYYHYAIAHIYAMRAANAPPSDKQEYFDKAIENYRAAIEAAGPGEISAHVEKELAEVRQARQLRPRTNVVLPVPPPPPK